MSGGGSDGTLCLAFEPAVGVCVVAVTVALTHWAEEGIKQSRSMRHCKQLEQLRGALIPARRTWDTTAAAAAWEIELPLKSDFSGCGFCNY